jgi:hypothetical protein
VTDMLQPVPPAARRALGYVSVVGHRSWMILQQHRAGSLGHQHNVKASPHLKHHYNTSARDYPMFSDYQSVSSGTVECRCKYMHSVRILDIPARGGKAVHQAGTLSATGFTVSCCLHGWCMCRLQHWNYDRV